MDKNTPAFPTSVEHGANSGVPGMSLRDYFAAKAMAVLMANSGDASTADVALCAYYISDAMMKAREE